MRIAIITLPLHTNYGGILQAYALQTVLQRMGHEVVLLDQSPYRRLPLWRKPLSYTKRAVNKFIFRNGSNIFVEKHYNQTYPIVSQFTQIFINKYINRIEVDNLSDLKEGVFDGIVVGSDQIWRPLYYPNIANAYLSFAASWNIKRVAYAPSFGTDSCEYTYKQIKCCMQELRKFNAVSVREDSGVRLCDKYFGVKAEHVLDPTMLLEVEDYIQVIRKANLPNTMGSLLCYILDDTKEKQDIIEKIAETKELIPFKVNSKVEDYNAPLNERIQPPVEQWLNGFYCAKLVVTDSFHACVFSILFNKPFIVIGNKERGLSRFTSLLRLFDLEDKLVYSTHDVCLDKVMDIDYDSINSKRKILLEKSNAFLLKNLRM